MKLVAAIAILWVASSCSARQNNNLYKNKRIIKVRVPPRQHPDFYNGPKGYLRPSSAPIRFKDYPHKHREFLRPSPPPFHYGYNNVYVKHQIRPQFQGPPSFPFGGSGFGKGYPKEILYQKFPSTYGSGFPHKGPVSSLKFPSIKDEIRATHNQVITSPQPVTQPPPPPPPPPPQPSPSSPSPPPSSSSSGSSYSVLYQPNSFYESPSHAHVQSYDDQGPIREIPAPNLGPKPSGGSHGDDFTYGKGPSIDVTNLLPDNGEQQLTFPATEYYSTFGRHHNFEIVNDNHLSTPSVYEFKDSVTPSAEISINGGVGVSTPATDLSPKTSSHNTPTPVPSSSYEVTEEQQNTESETSGTKEYYYAPDPDPSLPVYKVPPTKEVFTEEKNIVETYIPQQNFQILDGGSVAAPITTLSTQELYNLMHGYPRQVSVVAEPVITILGHQQSGGGIYVQPTFSYGQYQNGGSIHQQIIHHQENYVPQQQTYSEQNYESEYSQQSGSQSYPHSQQDYQYEPEASESRESESQMRKNEENSVESSDAQQSSRIIIQFNKLPEVPFYTTLPNKEAAEALASLQAAGSIGSNYVDRFKSAQVEKDLKDNTVYTELRGDQGEETEGDGEISSNIDVSEQQSDTLQKVEDTGKETLSKVEIQKSIPVFETSYSASSLFDNEHESHGSRESGISSESFGKRIRPK